jgi:hypothetical protein
MKMKKMPADSTVKRQLASLRRVINHSPDAVASRIAYAMEVAILWARTETCGWTPMAEEALQEAKLLREELGLLAITEKKG